ncbi:hypothetical protein ACFPER_18145 [Agromyces aurantiacus]|uniref:Nuclear transport factor 2 family protein n=1 Tax=Agromyces aurantiacus TaxID=165814 RepID=A0ABV9RBQ5_9MICO|nr:hypothetical protein [Agromyces aurantiacus]MBM7505412.1 hypothetical protein [Agromyces aurantiacus]
MAIDSRSLHEFFGRYGAALENFDARASAALWGPPRAMLSDAFAGSLGSDDEIAGALEQSYPLYRQLGLAGVEFDVLEEVPITEHITRARIRWHFLDADGERMSRSDYEYYVQRGEDGGLSVRFALGIDDAEQLAALMHRKGLDVPS